MAAQTKQESLCARLCAAAEAAYVLIALVAVVLAQAAHPRNVYGECTLHDDCDD